MTAKERYDAIVIGAGQAGTPLSTTLAQAEWKTALIEREHVGGTCVNEGCAPTKTMVASARVAYLVQRARFAPRLWRPHRPGDCGYGQSAAAQAGHC